ncbi:hypothetical protein P0D88_23885 [Paraburkholderia sp. RL18-103-BIB-C]|jgi:hypothetical protein|uniref:hypothetical protein n=1 Tax=unclassified Paraburkholderia TaxID=2615204 RepID=UPI0038BB72E5
MEHAYVQLLHLLAGHPAWSLTVVFLEAIALDAHDNWGAGLGATVLARVDCHGVAVALLASPEE